jgi:hypothetical protein
LALWSRQIARLGPDMRAQQLWILQARSRLIWKKSTATQRRSQFAMGLGLESGLALDAIANELTELLDLADAAAFEGNAPKMIGALTPMAERLFTIPPFVPDTDLPGNWRDILASWVSGVDVAYIGIDNMRLVEEAFAYRLTWALEALRMKRRVEGGESDQVEGGAAACLESGLPSSTMAMLIRAGLPSRIAARYAVNQTSPSYTNLAEMNIWLASNQITALSADSNFPSRPTHAV